MNIFIDDDDLRFMIAYPADTGDWKEVVMREVVAQLREKAKEAK